MHWDFYVIFCWFDYKWNYSGRENCPSDWRWTIALESALTVRHVNLVTGGQQIIAKETSKRGEPVTGLFCDAFLPAAVLAAGRSPWQAGVDTCPVFHVQVQTTPARSGGGEELLDFLFMIVSWDYLYFFHRSFVRPSLWVAMHFC